MKRSKVFRRFLLPRFVVTLIYAAKYRCFVSLRAEVEYSAFLVIGRGTKISSFTQIKASDGPLKIGSNVSIGIGCCIASREGGVEIGDDCLVSQHVSVLGGNYRYSQLDVPIRLQGMTSKGIRIGNNVWIGSNCVILDGSVIGDGAIVTPNSVVSGKIPENAICQGNPAKVIFTRR